LFGRSSKNRTPVKPSSCRPVDQPPDGGHDAFDAELGVLALVVGVHEAGEHPVTVPAVDDLAAGRAGTSVAPDAARFLGGLGGACCS
jgi:hypothetical protein